jgi:site-specific DNA-methyltransferase (adenine-specific)
MPPKGDRDNIVYGHGLSIPDPDAAVGRWPSNVLLSSPELFDEPNPYVVGSGAPAGENWSQPTRGRTDGSPVYDLGWTGDGRPVGYGDTGGPARFYLVPKADRNDREPVVRGQLAASEIVFEAHPNNPRCLRCELPRIGALGAPACECAEPEWAPVGDRPRENMHPTVKPTDLMRHLVRLVTPPGGLVLDPFLGSGSTLLAANAEGYRCIGIERDPESMAVTRARMAGHELGLGLDVAAPSRAPAKAGRFTGKRHGGEFWTDKTWAQPGLGLDEEEPAG